MWWTTFGIADNVLDDGNYTSFGYPGRHHDLKKESVEYSEEKNKKTIDKDREVMNNTSSSIKKFWSNVTGIELDVMSNEYISNYMNAEEEKHSFAYNRDRWYTQIEGMSGGPVVDSNNEVIGINNMVFSLKEIDSQNREHNRTNLISSNSEEIKKIIYEAVEKVKWEYENKEIDHKSEVKESNEYLEKIKKTIDVTAMVEYEKFLKLLDTYYETIKGEYNFLIEDFDVLYSNREGIKEIYANEMQSDGRISEKTNKLILKSNRAAFRLMDDLIGQLQNEEPKLKISISELKEVKKKWSCWRRI